MRTFSIAGAIAALSMAAATGAAAQTPQPSPSARELARQIFEASGGETNVRAIVDAIRNPLDAAVLKILPPDRRAAASDVQGAVYDEVTQNFMPKIVDYSIDLYATDFTEQQLADIAAFYATPTGKALVAKMPFIAQEMGLFAARQLPLIMPGVVDRLCARTPCTPEAKAALIAAMPGASRPSGPR